MTQVWLSLRTRLALLVVSGAILFSLRSRLEGLPGVTATLWLCWAVVFGGSFINAVEAAHERERGARG